MLTTNLGQRIVVRFARKPIYMPTAPSKLFRIAEHNFYSPLEIKQIKLLHESYRNQERSLMEFMKHEFYIPATLSGGLPAEFVAKEDELDRQLLNENEATNNSVAIEREKFFEQQVADMQNKVMQYKLDKEDKLLESSQAADDFVKNNDLNSFVTPENIEDMIDRAMENRVSHEFCIDRSGRIIK